MYQLSVFNAILRKFCFMTVNFMLLNKNGSRAQTSDILMKTCKHTFNIFMSLKAHELIIYVLQDVEG